MLEKIDGLELDKVKAEDADKKEVNPEEDQAFNEEMKAFENEMMNMKEEAGDFE